MQILKKMFHIPSSNGSLNFLETILTPDSIVWWYDSMPLWYWFTPKWHRFVPNSMNSCLFKFIYTEKGCFFPHEACIRREVKGISEKVDLSIKLWIRIENVNTNTHGWQFTVLLFSAERERRCTGYTQVKTTYQLFLGGYKLLLFEFPESVPQSLVSPDGFLF